MGWKRISVHGTLQEVQSFREQLQEKFQESLKQVSDRRGVMVIARTTGYDIRSDSHIGHFYLSPDAFEQLDAKKLGLTDENLLPCPAPERHSVLGEDGGLTLLAGDETTYQLLVSDSL